jgi:hypothetical protein
MLRDAISGATAFQHPVTPCFAALNAIAQELARACRVARTIGREVEAAGDEELAADARDVYTADTSDYAAQFRPTGLYQGAMCYLVPKSVL